MSRSLNSKGIEGESALIECRAMKNFQVGERIHLIDKKERHYALTLKSGEDVSTQW